MQARGRWRSHGVSPVRCGCCTLLLHVCDQVRLRIVKLGVITVRLYLCSITRRSTVRLAISCCPARHKLGEPCICISAR
jgi:hypothetical protein